MRKKIFFYCIALLLLVSGLFFFNRAYTELLRYTDIIHRTNDNFRHFKNLSVDISSAAVMNPELQRASDSMKPVKLFSADSLAIYNQVAQLRATVTDSVNVAIIRQLDSILHQEMDWLIKSNVPDSIVHHQAAGHIASLQQINLLNNQATQRVAFLLDLYGRKFDKTINELTIWMVGFILLAAVLLTYTSINLDRQRSKRLQKEKELEISNRLLKNAQSIGQMGNWQYDLQQDRLFWSDEMYHTWGLDGQRPGINYQYFLNSIHPEDIDKLLLQLGDAFSGKKELDAEHRIMLPGGNTRWVHEKGRLVIEQDPAKNVFEATVQDITDRKNAEIRLKEAAEQQALYMAIVNSSEDAIISKTLTGIITSWNHGAQNMFGYQADEATGQHINIIIPPDLIEEEVVILNKVNKGIYVEHYETERLKKDGSRFHVSVSVSPVMSPTGDILGASKIIRDITKQKEEQHQLKLLESVVTNTHDAIIITEAEPIDLPGPRIIYVNKAFTNMTGYTKEEVAGNTPRLLQGVGTDRDQLKLVGKALRKWQPVDATVLNYKKDGTAFWMNFSLSPVANESGRFTHWIAIAKDATYKHNEEMQKMLFAETSLFFNAPDRLEMILQKVLEQLVKFGAFSLAEAWLVGKDMQRINLVARYNQTDASHVFYEEAADVKSFEKGGGLPGIVWDTQSIRHWKNIAGSESFIRREAAKKAGLHNMSGIPLMHQGAVIGVLLLAHDKDETGASAILSLFDNYGHFLGAEIRRKQLEQELNQVFNSAPDIICISGTDGYMKRINPKGCELLGFTEEEILSVPYINFVHPDDRQRTAAVAETIHANLPSFYFENRFVSRAGKTIWLAWTTSPSSEEGLIFSVAKDITDKKELEDRLRKINNMAGIGSWEADSDKKTVRWSATIFRIFEVVQSTQPSYDDMVRFFKAGADRETLVSKMNEAIETGTSWDEELQVVTVAGHTKWVRVIGDAEFADGRCIRLFGSVQDIDQRKKAEIRAMETLLEKNTILESIGDAFFAVDLHWVVTYWNKHAEIILQTPRETVVGKYLWDVFPGSVNSESYKRYTEAFATQQVVLFEDFYPPVGRWYEISAYPSINGMAVYFKDITDRKIAEIHLKSLNESLLVHAKDLASSNKELEQFAYVASHDLQEPLRMVTSFLSQLEKKYEHLIDAKGKRYIDFAVDGARRMRQIILDLLEFSRVGRKDDNLETVDLNEIVSEIRLLFRKQLEEKKAVIHSDKLPVVMAGIAPMRQIFQNLVGNALKYSREGVPAEVSIKVQEHASEWQFAVADNGIGIEEEYFGKIFVIFQRLHNKDEYSGTGIGLAVTKKIVESLGGKIWLQSEEGKGTTFYFTILKHHDHPL